MSDKPGHASSVLDQLKQAQADGDLPDELAAKYDLAEPADESADQEVDDA
ncbi:hypothetical protein BJ1_gp11 [Halorubrum virus BJ1]|uniref:Uncharacterized protein n=1 Tax=Halorubrum virus BJ1 TaxID=416419 RepID=A0ZYM4_9CAUD|nr:hypothetical protein BJ1_gp11 [Halorubrum virus BJ1]CAL92433.1 hypothetical protein [Halorubrum virus BJ1]